MGKEIADIAEALSNERVIPKEKIYEAMELALATATKKKYKVEVAVRVVIDRKDGSYRTYRRWTVVDHEGPLENPSYEISLEAARLENPNIQPGDVVEEEIESVGFDRITIQTAKQVLAQKVKDAEREQIIAEQRDRVGHVINATVKKQTSKPGHDFLVLDLGNNAEAVLRRDQLIGHETFGRGDRVKVLLQEIRQEPGKSPQIVCSRTSPDFLRELFRIEVPEIGEDVIEVMGVARDPGSRAKLAVRSKDRRIDPRGACIGMRGSRVNAVSNEVGGERIDVVLWDENLAQYVSNAMEPAEVARIIIDEDAHVITVAVEPENMALAIGRNGQNVRLVSQLIGWDVKVMTEGDMQSTQQAAQARIQEEFMGALEIDEEFAAALYEYGFSRLEEIAFVPVEEFEGIEGLEREMAETLQQRARDELTRRATLARTKAVEALVVLPGLDEETAGRFYDAGLKSVRALAEQATDDVIELEGLKEMPRARIEELIIAARDEMDRRDPNWYEVEPAEDEAGGGRSPAAATQGSAKPSTTTSADDGEARK